MSNVRELRERLELTQQELAVELGVSVTTVSRWEQNNKKPRGAAGKLYSQLEKKARKT
jgi:putative transcriptional regulator